MARRRAVAAAPALLKKVSLKDEGMIYDIQIVICDVSLKVRLLRRDFLIRSMSYVNVLLKVRFLTDLCEIVCETCDFWRKKMTL